jgi:hypothetical protein
MMTIYDNNMITTNSTTIPTITVTPTTGSLGTYSISPNTSAPTYGYYPNPLYNQNITLNNTSDSQLMVRGDATFEGDVTIKGKSLLDAIESLEKRLGLLHPNPKLEGRWEELKELGERYRALEKEILEKEKMWTILQK